MAIGLINIGVIQCNYRALKHVGTLIMTCAIIMSVLSTNFSVSLRKALISKMNESKLFNCLGGSVLKFIPCLMHYCYSNNKHTVPLS